MIHKIIPVNINRSPLGQYGLDVDALTDAYDDLDALAVLAHKMAINVSTLSALEEIYGQRMPNATPRIKMLVDAYTARCAIELWNL